ncbi:MULTISPECIES: EboA domain-containing protein [unclassified Frankia]|uniref:EboA domain-containing protein n=1 Tax=unclassified Frankia TaxID=2632575 RepID=UPI002AD529EC|nr:MULTISPECIES: EboA domain-containing protein [unclassified Frankia]
MTAGDRATGERATGERATGDGGLSVDGLASTLALRLTGAGHAWLTNAVSAVGGSADTIDQLFPAVRRHCGHGPLLASTGPATGPATGPGLHGWTVDEAARVLLLTALPISGDALAGTVARLYERGDAAERRAVLRALPLLDVGPDTVAIVRDALRTNDATLVAAALGPYAARHLDDASWRQGVLKCVFLGVRLSEVADLTRRADEELVRMLVAFAHERIAAGRDVPPDVLAVVESFQP